MTPEKYLSERDPVLARIISSYTGSWPTYATEDPIWGLIRIIIAQQISTSSACTLADNLRLMCPDINHPYPGIADDLSISNLKSLGIPKHRAQCCIDVLKSSDNIRTKITNGESWESALCGIKGIGPWTLSVFKIMILRKPDIFPLKDLGLERAIFNAYRSKDVEQISENWKPFRSVGCWYLWKTLGNRQLG